MSATRLRLLTAEDASAESTSERDADALDLDAALAFLESLAARPAPAWAECGRRLLANGPALAAHSGARQALLSALWDRELSWTVWQVRDAADTAACIARSSGRPLPVRDRAVFELACAAACEAALALLVRQRLAASELDALYLPFRHPSPRAAAD